MLFVAPFCVDFKLVWKCESCRRLLLRTV